MQESPGEQGGVLWLGVLVLRPLGVHIWFVSEFCNVLSPVCLVTVSTIIGYTLSLLP